MALLLQLYRLPIVLVGMRVLSGSLLAMLDVYDALCFAIFDTRRPLGLKLPVPKWKRGTGEQEAQAHENRRRKHSCDIIHLFLHLGPCATSDSGPRCRKLGPIMPY
jgi:hypothetical protein